MKAWYPRYTADYAMDAGHLSMMQHGAYTLLLDYYYGTGKKPPADAAELHRICKAKTASEKGAVNRVVEEFFVRTSTQELSHVRVERELAKRKAVSESKAKGAFAMHAKRAHAVQDSAYATHPQPQPHKDKDKKSGDIAWDVGVAFLANNAADGQARGVIGTFIKQFGAEAVDAAAVQCVGRKVAGDRIAYMRAILNNERREGSAPKGESFAPPGML